MITNCPTHAFRRLVLIALVLAVTLSAASAHHLHHAHSHWAHQRHRDVSRAGAATRGESTSQTSRGVVAERDPEAFRQPVTELRGMWVTRYSITSPEQIHNVVATARQYGFNTLFVQVRGRGDAFYNSSLEPRSEDLSGEPETFDQLAEVIKEAHAAGIQVHAWLNCCFVWSGPERPKSPMHVLNAHPDWFDRRSDGTFTTEASAQCEGAFLSPANPDARQHIHDVFLDIVNHYEVDGIHFDYIRYPNSAYDYSSTTLMAFCAQMRQSAPDAPASGATQTQMLAYVKANATGYADWRRQQVTSLVEDTCRDAKAIKPGLICSAAVFADWKDAYENRGQDWKRWLTDGALDAVVPMAYSTDTAVVAHQIKDAEATAAAAGRFCYAGLGAWHLSEDSTVQKIEAVRSIGAQGFVLFSYSGVTKNGETDGYIKHIAETTFQHPATLPDMSWLKTASSDNAPSSPATPPAAK